MDQSSPIFSLFERIANGKPLTAAELKKAKSLLFDKNFRNEIDEWITHHWNSSDEKGIEIGYERLQHKINLYEREKKLSHRIYSKTLSLTKYYSRIAAILFLPLITAVFAYFIFSPKYSDNIYTAEAPLGQKAKVEMPDGSVIWLNSGSSIRYSSEFNHKTREVELTGEAFFHVSKNVRKPFFVHTKHVDVQVTGTKFNLNSYDYEPVVETALIEGSVYVHLPGEKQKYSLTLGNVLAYSKESGKVSRYGLKEEEKIAWKENRLIFVNDDFFKLARKIEYWYNMEVVFNPSDFVGNKLTVKLFEGEQLDKLLEIVESALGAQCTVQGNKIVIKKKMPMR